MTKTELGDIWTGVSAEPLERGYRSLLMDSSCKSELFISLSPAGERCLILRFLKILKLS